MAAFLAELREQDIHVWRDGDQLRCNAPAGVLTPSLREALRTRKRDIVDFLDRATAASKQQRAVVPLQARGSLTPIFGVPGHNGDVFCYRVLSQHLGNDQPFFALEPPGLHRDETPVKSVEELAAYFATQIREFRPNGPFVVAGYCAGGVIAFELAQQLAAQGAQIGNVALFAGAYPDWYGVLPQLRHRARYEIRRAAKHMREVASLPYRDARVYLRDKLQQRKASIAANPPEDVLAMRARVKAAIGAAVRRYVPQYYGGRLTLFLPRRPHQALLRWRSLAAHVDEFCSPDDCDGDVMLLDPWAAAIASLYRSAH